MSVAPALTATGWGAHTLAPAGALGDPPRLAAIGKPVGCELWWIGADGSVTGVWSQPGDPWASYQLAGPGSASPHGGIAAISKGGDNMEVWWIGADGSVQAAYHEGEWHTYVLADPGSAIDTGGIAAISKGGDNMEVWWIAPDGSVQASYHEGGWNRYALTGPGEASTTGGIAAVSKGGDNMEVWWVAPDGSVQASYHEGGWNRYALAGPGESAPTCGPTAISKGGDAMEVWWVAPDGSVQGAYHDSSWNRYVLTGPSIASTTCRLSSWFGSTRHNVTMRMWWTGPAGMVWQASYDGAWANLAIGDGTAHPSGAVAGIAFNPETVGAFWGANDGSLIDAIPDEVTHTAHVAAGRAMRGVVGLTVRSDGSSEWWGDITNDTFYGYNYAVSAYMRNSGLRLDIAGAHQGHVSGYAEPGSSDDLWSVPHGPQAILAAGLGSYRFGSLGIRIEHSVDLVDYLEQALAAIFEAVSGTVLVEVGAVLVLGAEIVTLAFTGSAVPGAIIAGGMPWLTGPAGVFVRVLVDAAGDNGRYLTDAEYEWANDVVFKGALPPLENMRVTNYLGIGDAPFTFPTFGGPTLINVGPKLYANIHLDEGTMIHELVHACQIAHSNDPAFTATAAITKLFDPSGDTSYDYGPAGFDYKSVNFEAQAQIVEDWFLGSPRKQKTPENRNHSGFPMDPESPYYRYVVDDLRTGRF